jgi:predicted AAA+ superfamily ATPase
MENIRDVLLTQKRELERYGKKQYVERNIELTALNTDIIKVITGPRRAGKSFFAIHELKKTGRIGYVNFDDETLVKITNYNEILEVVNSLYNNPGILFLDEIQNLPQWELFVNRLQRQGYNLVITGSNSRLLSKELATHLTGRHLGTVVFPFSFKEYLSYFNREMTTGEIKMKMQDYLYYGGFPEPLVKDIDYNEYLKTLFDSVIFNDILKRHNIKKPKPISDLARYLVSNSGSPVSYRSLAKMIGIKSTHTIQKYLGHLEEAFLFFQLNSFSFKYKDQVKANKKIYTIDNGYIGSKAFRFTPNIGILYENLAAVELKKRELRGELEFYYYKTVKGYEIDFLVKKGMNITCLFQVAYNVEDEKTRNREVRALIHGAEELKCDNLVVLTGDYEHSEEVEWYGVKGKIRYIPLWRWLINSEEALA